MVDKNKKPDIRKPLYFGVLVLLGFVLSFVVWATFVPLDSAAIAEGKVVVDSYKKTIQHLEGGIVQAVYVKDGDLVKKGQPLLKIDNTKAQAQMNADYMEYYTLQAREARLLTARDNKSAIVFPEKLLTASRDPVVKKIIQDQENIFSNNSRTYNQAQQALDEQIALNQKEVKSITDQINSLKEQYAYLGKETVAVESLLEKNYIEKTRYWQLKREAHRMRGMAEEMQTKILQTQQKITQAQSDKIRLANERSKRILDELYETRNNLETITHQVVKDADILKRTVVVAPLSGVVLNLSVHTVGGVVKPGDVLMDIVPNNDKLIAEIRVNPINVDDVRVGMPAKIKLLAYNQRVIPELKAKLIYLSADSITDKSTGKSYYLGRVVVDADQLKGLKNVKLFPGMPVQAFIFTEKSTFMHYLLSPVAGSFDRAFREN